MTARRAGALAALVVLLNLAFVPAGSGQTVVTSGNVDLVAHVPLPGLAGGKTRTIRGTDYFIATGAGGVYAFDVTIPEVPVLVGHLPLPHFSNEDVEFGDDVLLATTDPAWTTSVASGLYVVDLSLLPAMTFHYLNPATQNRFVSGTYRGGHTVSCIRSDCSWAYAMGPGGGSDAVHVIDLTTPSAPVVVRTFESPVGGTHDVQTDDDGLAWLVGSGGVVAYDTTDPVHPVEVVRRNLGTDGLTYVHNSMRPDAGDLLLMTEEHWLQPFCDGQGEFATATVDVASGDLVVEDRYSTEIGQYVDGDSAATITCSAHYFDVQDDVVAIAWYQQGIRFLDVSDRTDIRQIGYFLGPASEVWATQWVADGVVYGLGTDGLSVLQFDGSAGTSASVVAPVLPEWLGGDPVGTDAVPHPVWGYACRLDVGR